MRVWAFTRKLALALVAIDQRFFGEFALVVGDQHAPLGRSHDLSGVHAECARDAEKLQPLCRGMTKPWPRAASSPSHSPLRPYPERDPATPLSAGIRCRRYERRRCPVAGDGCCLTSSGPNREALRVHVHDTGFPAGVHNRRGRREERVGGNQHVTCLRRPGREGRSRAPKVPLFTEIACLTPHSAAKRCSNSLPYLPRVSCPPPAPPAIRSAIQRRSSAEKSILAAGTGACRSTRSGRSGSRPAALAPCARSAIKPTGRRPQDADPQRQRRLPAR